MHTYLTCDEKVHAARDKRQRREERERIEAERIRRENEPIPVLDWPVKKTEDVPHKAQN